MKAWEICKEENVGKKYKDNSGTIWKVFRAVLTTGTCYDLKNNLDEVLSTNFYMSDLAELDFEEIIDWSKVPVDTKILVRVADHNEWNKRHFAKFENGFIYAWDNGKTSFTSNTKASYTSWKQTKLYEEGEE